MGINAGELNGRAKLDWQKISRIRRLYDTGDCTMKELGKRFGVATSTISYVVNHRTWRKEAKKQD